MKTSRTTARLAAALAFPLVLGLSACSDETGTTGAASETASSSPSPSASPTPVAQIETLEGVDTAVTLDPGFVDALTGLSVTPGVVGEAVMEGGTVSFPITGGTATYYDPDSGVRPYVQGRVEHTGGLSLTAGGKTVQLTDFVIDPEESVLTGTVTVDGEVVAEDANIFFLDGRTLNPIEVNAEENTAVLEGTTVKLHPDAVGLLSETFGTDQIPDFLTVGIAEITLALPGWEPETAPTAGASESQPAGTASESASPSTGTETATETATETESVTPSETASEPAQPTASPSS